MENVKDSRAKNKKMKIALSYVSLFILIVLLFAPFISRIAFKDKKDKDVKKDVVTLLSCEKSSERINSSFLNDVPKNIKYQIEGNYEAKEEESSDNTQEETEEDQEENDVLNLFTTYVKATFDEEKNVTIVQFDVQIKAGEANYENVFSSVDKQENYYKSKGFMCTKTTA